jgi:hypothetical protein
MDIVISLIQVNQYPSTTYQRLFVDENAVQGTVFCRSSQLKTTDVDSKYFTYSLRMDINSTAFAINGLTGALSVGSAGLNFEVNIF